MKIVKTTVVAPVCEYNIRFNDDEMEHIYDLLTNDKDKNEIDASLSAEMAHDLHSFIY